MRIINLNNNIYILIYLVYHHNEYAQTRLKNKKHLCIMELQEI